MPREVVRPETPSDLNPEEVQTTEISVGWMRGGYVQVGVVRKMSPNDYALIVKGVEPEQHGTVVRIGYPTMPEAQTFVRFDNLGSKPDKAKSNQVAHWRNAMSGHTITWDDVKNIALEMDRPIYIAMENDFRCTEAWELDQGWSDNLSRRDVNELIKLLRKGRDACHGKDE